MLTISHITKAKLYTSAVSFDGRLLATSGAMYLAPESHRAVTDGGDTKRRTPHAMYSIRCSSVVNRDRAGWP